MLITSADSGNVIDLQELGIALTSGGLRPELELELLEEADFCSVLGLEWELLEEANLRREAAPNMIKFLITCGSRGILGTGSDMKLL
jgi:hypothetical protein